MDISYDSYRVFYFAAKYRSFTQAAGVLGSNQPNVTRTIRKLEEALGCQLFLRSNQGVRLTVEGEKLYAHVAVAFEHIQAGEEEIAAGRSLESGVVTVAASEIALHCCLLPVLKDYRSKHPHVHIRVSNSTTTQASEALRNGLADMAAVVMSPQLPKTLHQQHIMEIQDLPVASSKFAFLRGRTLKLRELSQYPQVGLGPQTATFSFYSRLFSQQGLPYQPEVEAATADQLLPLIKSDLGIGFVPESFAQEDILAGNVLALRLETSIPKRSLCLLKRENQPLPAAARELERMILARYNRL